MRKNYDSNSFYYFNEVLDFNWLGVRMMCWVRIHSRISLKSIKIIKHGKNCSIETLVVLMF